MRDVTEELTQAQLAGEHVKQLRANPVFAQVFTAEKARLFNEFSRSKWYQRAFRRSLWAQCQAVNALESRLAGIEYHAEMAAQEAKRLKDKQESMRSKLRRAV